MRILKNQGKSTTIATWPSPETNVHAQKILEKAGRICYQSEKNPITSETANKFIKNACIRTHYSILEHGWRGYMIKDRSWSYSDIIYAFWPISKYMYITYRKGLTLPDPGAVLMSASLETWRKLYKCGNLMDPTLHGIQYDLGNFCPAIFPRYIASIPAEGFSTIPITSVDQLITDEERLNHIAHTTIYDNCSIGMIKELDRHRPPVFSEESTRYVDESTNFEVIVPPHRDEGTVNGIDCTMFDVTQNIPELQDLDLCHFTLARWLLANKGMYQALLKAGWRPEDARQILPLALRSQTAMTCNLLERRYIYFRRTSPFAHWEIRKVMCDELADFQKQYPQDLEMFEHTNAPAKDGIPGYCKLKPNYNADFFCDK